MDFETTPNIEQADNSTQSSSQDVGSQESSSGLSNQTAAQQAYELEKLGKFKFDGQDWTAEDLKKAVLRQKDYTQKTQALSEEKKTYESVKSEQKFYENLHFDLQSVRDNPSLAQAFIQTYPDKFHSYLKQVLSTNAYQQVQGQAQQSQPTVDVDLYSRLQKLEKTYDEQQVSQRIESINNNLKTLSQKYPQVPEKYVLAKVHDASERGERPTVEVFERAFKEVQAEFDQYVKQRSKDMQKSQLDANKKAKDVSTGGGNPTKAPQKFKNLSDVTKYAAENIKF